MVTKRARDSKQKNERKKIILESAWQLYIEQQGSMPSVSQIAQKAGLAKGTVYLYFKTKEEIFLSLMEQEFEELFSDLAVALADSQSTSYDKIVQTIVECVCHRNVFLKLGNISSGILEINIDPDILYQYKIRLVNLVKTYAKVIEGLFPQLNDGQGVKLLLRTYITILGVSHVIPASIEIKTLLSKPELEILNMNFTDELKETLLLLWKGALNIP